MLQSNKVVIEGSSVTVIEYNGQPVISLSMVDNIHRRPEETAGRNFRENKNRLIEGEDYFKVCADEIRRFKIMELSSKVRGKITLLTETGYLMLVKSFTDDLAWAVQRQLVKGYFRQQQQYFSARQLVTKLNLPVAERRQASCKISAELRRFLLLNNYGHWLRISEETGRYLYHNEGIGLWKAKGRGQVLLSALQAQIPQAPLPLL